MLEAPAEKLYGVTVRGAEACPADFPGGAGDGTVCEAHDTAVGESDPEDRGGEGGAGGVAMVIGLTGDVPGNGPHPGIDVLQQSGVAHVVFEEGAGDEGEGCDGDKEAGAGGQPCRAVRGEATAGHEVVEVRVVLEWPAPGMQDTRDTREVCPEETRVLGEPFAGFRRGVEHSVGPAALLRAEKGTPGVRDGEGEEKGRSGELFLQVGLEPLRGCMLLPLGTVAVATGMMDAVLASTAWALIEAVAIMAALALWDGAEDLSVCGRKGRITLQVFGRKGGADGAEGGHGRNPCRRALRRSEASSCPLWGRWRETMVVLSWVWPK
jgi:hypothetical protein